MALESGRYYIFSKLDDAAVGRNSVEDRTLLPKAVYKLPKGVDAPVWDVEKLPNGKYKLQTRGAAVGAVDGLLVAFLMKTETTLEWTIQRDERDTEGNSYIISTFDGHSWVVTEPESEDISQIAVRPLIVGMSLPPFYPPTEVFVFKKVD
ncbi:hypothetical protein GSI_07851 [Ganoderma sinense ZZ0214-1]|uniref:Uncharacterized protein n=1 Tax=Ganoderma sinense ZZ0214-1 TaxID=1077348 RepID=A0A2G8S834_9APHY|nr:hypothetical protein GSI_07851 [Ganoderma sinense ZZ0214-1]